MKKSKTINVRVYASIEGYEEKDLQTFYHVTSIDTEDLNGDNEGNDVLLSGAGIIGGFNPCIKWAESTNKAKYETIEDLVKAIKKGADENNLCTFHFLFDYPENFFVDHSEDSLESYDGCLYWHGRKFSHEERELFINTYIALCAKK